MIIIELTMIHNMVKLILITFIFGNNFIIYNNRDDSNKLFCF